MAVPQSTFFERNKTLVITGAVILLLLLIIVGWIGATYNGLVNANENVNNRWGNVQTQYQRRADLIPNLVQVVSAYAKQEREVLTEVTNARARVGQVQINPQDLTDPERLRTFQEAQSQLGGALSRLIAVAENYPELRSNENFLSLQNQLEGTENRIAVARRDYNEAVQSYNVRVQRFPSNVIAGWFGFVQKSYYEAEESAQDAPKITADQIVP
jgi:LemA protein